MVEPPNIFPPMPGEAPPGSTSPHKWREAARRSLLRRFLALLAAGSAAFAFSTWTLVRFESPLSHFGLESGPARVVQAHFEALNRGELRAAYELFSPRYREQVSFEAYHELVATHRRMFLTRELRFSRNEERGERAVLETHTVTQSGERCVGRFTLVRDESRWWIDDLRWSVEPGDNPLVAV